VNLRTTRAAVSRRKTPAHSQVAPWEETVQPRVMSGRLAQGDHFSGQPGHERIGAARRVGQRDVSRLDTTLVAAFRMPAVSQIATSPATRPESRPPSRR
jgi:hypothetical protein